MGRNNQRRVKKGEVRCERKKEKEERKREKGE